MKYLQFLRIWYKKSRQIHQQLHCFLPHPKQAFPIKTRQVTLMSFEFKLKDKKEINQNISLFILESSGRMSILGSIHWRMSVWLFALRKQLQSHDTRLKLSSNSSVSSSASSAMPRTAKTQCYQWYNDNDNICLQNLTFKQNQL